MYCYVYSENSCISVNLVCTLMWEIDGKPGNENHASSTVVSMLYQQLFDNLIVSKIL